MDKKGTRERKRFAISNIFEPFRNANPDWQFLGLCCFIRWDRSRCWQHHHYLWTPFHKSKTVALCHLLALQLIIFFHKKYLSCSLPPQLLTFSAAQLLSCSLPSLAAWAWLAYLSYSALVFSSILSFAKPAKRPWCNSFLSRSKTNTYNNEQFLA